MLRAEYNNGILTVTTTGVLQNTDELTYTITGKDQDDAVAEGSLSDIMTKDSPLTLDISSLDLAKGEYILKIGEETAEFVIQ